MATTNNITTTYSGEASARFVSAALLSSPTIYQGNIEVMPNVKYKQVIRKFDTDGLVKDATCDFTDTSTLTTVERIITPKELQVNLELCKKDFHSSWSAISMGYSAHDNLPPDFASYLVQYVAAKVAAANEVSVWAGATGTSGQFDGFTTLMAADAAVVDAANLSETAFSSTNIIDLLGSVVDSIPTALFGQEDLAIYVPQIAYQAYIRALGGFGASGLGAAGVNAQGTQWYNNGNALSYEGIKVVLAPGMPADHVVAGQKSNMFFGTGLVSDHTDVRVIDMAATSGSQNVRVVMRYTAGVQYGTGSDLVLLTLAP